MMIVSLLAVLLLQSAEAFIAYSTTHANTVSSTACNIGVSSETIASIGYTVQVNKPLGVVFGENPAPFYGLVVDDVESGLNGGKAGLRVGDQLLAVDGKPVIGSDFDSAMDLLRESPDPLEIDLYRGTANQLYTILMNLKDESGDEYEEQVNEAEEVIMDENYESPVKVDLTQYEEQSLEESLNNVKKNLGKMFGGNKKEGEKKKGLFGGMFSKETIQLEDEDGK